MNPFGTSALRHLGQLTATLVLLVVTCSTGCSSRSSSDASTNAPSKLNMDVTEGKPISVSQSNGDVELTAQVASSRVRLSDELTLTMTVRKPQNIRVDFPSLENQIAGFRITDTNQPLPKLDGEIEVLQRIYRLQPASVGKFSVLLPPVIFFPADADLNADPASNQADLSQFVEVDPIDIEVLTAFAGKDISLDKLRDQAAPMQLPQDRRKSAIWIALIAVGCLIATVLVGAWLSRRSSRDTTLSPRDAALRDLGQLTASDLARRDLKLFYVELTGIVRRFIEGVTGIRAPEQTTEEFLRELSNRENISSKIKDSLGAFLESADLVKFAGLNPSSSDVEQSLSSARHFIESTEIANPAVGLDSSSASKVDPSEAKP